MLPRGLADRLRGLADRPDDRRLGRDPLGLVREAGDRETAALLGALLAFGNAKAIRKSLAAALGAVAAGSPLRGRFRHRWVEGGDVDRLLRGVKEARARFGSLEDLFLAGDDGDLGTALDRFASALRGRRPTRGLRFLLPRPADGSACKRPVLFLRWVVRREGADLGLWRRVDPARLVVPLDTHVHRIAYWLGLTARKTPSWRTALEVTEALREADSDDPARFDFALAHLGILGDCPRRPLPSKCAPCPLRPWCRAWRGETVTSRRAPLPVPAPLRTVFGPPPHACHGPQQVRAVPPRAAGPVPPSPSPPAHGRALPARPASPGPSRAHQRSGEQRGRRPTPTRRRQVPPRPRRRGLLATLRLDAVFLGPMHASGVSGP